MNPSIRSTGSFWSIGVASLLLLCSQKTPLVLADQLDLGGGVFVTAEFGQSFADLSQDVGSIQQFLDQGQALEALGLYKSGQHAEASPGVKRSLASLGDDLANAAVADHTPPFLFHLYGQADRALNLAFDVQKLNYINNEIEQIFNTQPQYAVDAILSINLWMQAVHLWYKAVRQCQLQTNDQFNPQVVGASGVELVLKPLEEFMALWMGSGQAVSSSQGDSLYAWTQRYATEFATVDTASGEALVNTRLKLFYQEAASMLATDSACTSSNQGSVERLWQLTLNVETEMTKVLLQGFLSSLYDYEANEGRLRVYGMALVPTLSKCRPSVYKTFHEQLIESTTLPSDTTWITDLANMIPDVTYCLGGFSCSELGNTRIGACSNHDVVRPIMGGFYPQTPVGNVAAADLDIYQLQILASLKSNSYAYLMYMNGANIRKAKRQANNEPTEYVSLHDIAVSSERSSAQPEFDIYVTYNGEKNYADQFIQDALLEQSKWTASAQIATYVATTAAYQILFLEAITKLRIAVAECEEADPDIGYVQPTLNPIDEAVALLVGSMEGANLGGSPDLEDGKLIFHVANKHAFQFGTSNTLLYANSVSTMEDLFFAARGELDALDCANLAISTEALLRYSMVGLTQELVNLAVQIDQDLGEFSTAAELARAEAVSLALLPLVANVNADAATKLAGNFIRVQGQDPLPSGSVNVGKLLGQSFTETFNLQCSTNIGSLPAVDPCEGVQCSGECFGVHTKRGGSGSGGDDDNNAMAKWAAAFASVVLIGSIFFVWRRNSRFTNEINERRQEQSLRSSQASEDRGLDINQPKADNRLEEAPVV